MLNHRQKWLKSNTEFVSTRPVRASEKMSIITERSTFIAMAMLLSSTKAYTQNTPQTSNIQATNKTIWRIRQLEGHGPLPNADKKILIAGALHSSHSLSYTTELILAMAAGSVKEQEVRPVLVSACAKDNAIPTACTQLYFSVVCPGVPVKITHFASSERTLLRSAMESSSLSSSQLRWIRREVSLPIVLEREKAGSIMVQFRGLSSIDQAKLRGCISTADKGSTPGLHKYWSLVRQVVLRRNARRFTRS